MKQRLLIICLLVTFKVHCYEARDLFTIMEDAISIGREILKEVEQTIPKDAKINDVKWKFLNVLRKFNDKHNVPVQLVRFNTLMSAELTSSRTLVNYLYFMDSEMRTFVSYKPKLLPQIFESNRSFGTYDFSLPYYLDENVFDLQIFKSTSTQMSIPHKLLFEKDPDTGETIMNIFANKPSEWHCWSASRQQLLYSLLYSVVYENAFGYIFMQYKFAAYKVYNDAFKDLKEWMQRKLKSTKSTWTEKDVIKRMKNFEKDFIEKNTNTLNQFIVAMTGQSREVIRCKKEGEYKSDTDKEEYIKLENVFQKYIVNEVDLNVDGTCKNECSNYYQTKQYGCYDDLRICKRQRTCNGTLWECGTQIDSPMKVCLTDEDKEPRYDFILTKSTTYGKKHPCNKIVTVKNWPRGFYVCTYCTCTCENNNIGDRYFSVRPALSDTDANYVITNARFVKKNQVLHIQVEEGKLIANALIHQATLRWRTLDNFTIFDENIKEGVDYHTITWYNRKVYLDEFDSPRNFVLTGLQLYSDKDAIKLKIYSKPFDFKSGKLLDGGQWITSTGLISDERTELKFENKDDINNKNYKNKYIQFSASNVNIDAGQSTVPSINTRAVIDDKIFRMPFSGAGIIAKSEKDVGSFLALKFLTYNIVENL